jgi:hypothetical protein
MERLEQRQVTKDLKYKIKQSERIRHWSFTIGRFWAFSSVPVVHQDRP